MGEWMDVPGIYELSKHTHTHRHTHIHSCRRPDQTSSDQVRSDNT